MWVGRLLIVVRGVAGLWGVEDLAGVVGCLAVVFVARVGGSQFDEMVGAIGGVCNHYIVDLGVVNVMAGMIIETIWFFDFHHSLISCIVQNLILVHSVLGG